MIFGQEKRYSVSKFHMFIAGAFILKIALMGIFSSDYQNVMFMRFVNGFLSQLSENHIVNPYEFFRQEPKLFPYPPLMLGIECIGGALSLCIPNLLFLKNVLFKLPSLFFDCLGLYYLMLFCPEKRKYIAVLYFASPIILYSTYMHGQLDIIPTTLLLGAIVHLTLPKYRSDIKYCLLLASAIACKLHILAILPVLFLFIFKRDSLVRALEYTLTPILLVILLIIPFWGDGFIHNVLLNEEQSVLVKVFWELNGIKLYIPIMAVFLIYLKVFTINKINRDLLYSFCGILFAVFLALVPPRPGWYMWIVPFITIFFADLKERRNFELIIFVALNISYILYFLFAHHTSYVNLYFWKYSMDWIKTENMLIVNGLFTFMTSLLIYSIYAMYQAGVVSNSFYRRKNQAFIIGIAGDSGSGKSTLTDQLSRLFGKKELLILEGDGDHRWERGNAMWDYYTHLNPGANYLYRQAQDLERLKNGESVIRIDYNHDTGRFTKENKVKSKPYIILSGLHSLYLPQLRNVLDLKIYMDIDEDLRCYWKLQRDALRRGHNKEEILRQIAVRKADAEKYIYPQKKYADLIISYFDFDLNDCMDENYTVMPSVKVTLNMEIDLEPLIQRIRNCGGIVQHDYNENLEMQSMILDGRTLRGKPLPIVDIANEMIPRLDEIINHQIETTDNLTDILMLLVLLLISRKLQED